MRWVPTPVRTGPLQASRVPPCVETCSNKVYEKRRELRELLYRKYGRTKQFSFKPKYFTKVKSIRRSGGIRKTNRMTTCKYLPRNPLGSFARYPLERTLNEKPLVSTYRETHLRGLRETRLRARLTRNHL